MVRFARTHRVFFFEEPISIESGEAPHLDSSWQLTVLGSFLWCTILAWYGQRVGREHPGAIEDPERFMGAVKADLHWLVLAVVVLAGLYILVTWLTRPRSEAPVAKV